MWCGAVTGQWVLCGVGVVLVQSLFSHCSGVVCSDWPVCLCGAGVVFFVKIKKEQGPHFAFVLSGVTIKYNLLGEHKINIPKNYLFIRYCST